jgi:hypothetical protein
VRVSPESVRSARTALAAAGLLACLQLAALPVSALSIRDTQPVWFLGGGAYGLDAAQLAAAGLAPSLQADPADGWIDAGATSLDLPLAIDVDLQKVHRNPQAGGKRPSLRKPVIADSIWTITNRSGEALEDALLVFTLGDTSGRRKPKPVALDGNLVEILEYSAGGVDYLFGAVRLGDLAAEGPASSVSITVRYIVGGPLQRSGRRLLLPPLGVAGVTGWTLVPEPSTGAALAFGLLALAASRRRR